MQMARMVVTMMTMMDKNDRRDYDDVDHFMMMLQRFLLCRQVVLSTSISEKWCGNEGRRILRLQALQAKAGFVGSFSKLG